MYSRQASRLFVAACGAAALLSVACGNDGNNASDRTAKANEPAAAATPAADANASSRAAEQRVNLTGCLQRGDGRSYILTEMNTPDAGRVASGENPNANKVEKEQLHAAQHAYRLSADNNDDLDKLVGARVRVEGSLAEKSDLRADANDRAQDRSVGTSGDKDRDKNKNKSSDRNEKIDSSDLAKVNVASIEKISDGCATAKKRAVKP
jgi:hypothetical protein